jgi:hypothetical protein
VFEGVDAALDGVPVAVSSAIADGFAAATVMGLGGGD